MFLFKYIVTDKNSLYYTIKSGNRQTSLRVAWMTICSYGMYIACWHSRASFPWVDPRTTVPWHISAWFKSVAFCSSSSIPQILHSTPLAGQGVLTCFRRKCFVSEPAVAYSLIRSMSARLGFPTQRKQIRGRCPGVLIRTDSIACRRAISVSSSITCCCRLVGAQ